MMWNGDYAKITKSNRKITQPIGGSYLNIAGLSLKDDNEFDKDKRELLYCLKCDINGLKFIYVGYTGTGINAFCKPVGRLGMHIIKLLAIAEGSRNHVNGWQDTAKSIYKHLIDKGLTDSGAIENFVKQNVSVSLGYLADESKIKPYELYVLNYFKGKYQGYSVLNDINDQLHPILIHHEQQ